jgi:hypothetical protein
MATSLPPLPEPGLLRSLVHYNLEMLSHMAGRNMESWMIFFTRQTHPGAKPASLAQLEQHLHVHSTLAYFVCEARVFLIVV